MGGRRRRIAFIAMARTGGTVRVGESCELGKKVCEMAKEFRVEKTGGIVEESREGPA